VKTRISIRWSWTALAVVLLAGGAVMIAAAEDFQALVSRLQQEKPSFAKRQQTLLTDRYDMADRATDDRRALTAHQGVACLDCHANGHTNAGFFKEVMINGRLASADGPIKTFPLRGIKDSPPYLHDDRLLTLDDTVEFFNLVLGVKLADQEKKDLVAFMRAL
jgi:cytochrome c peroxidase